MIIIIIRVAEFSSSSSSYTQPDTYCLVVSFYRSSVVKSSRSTNCSNIIAMFFLYFSFVQIHFTLMFFFVELLFLCSTLPKGLIPSNSLTCNYASLNFDLHFVAIFCPTAYKQPRNVCSNIYNKYLTICLSFSLFGNAAKFLYFRFIFVFCLPKKCEFIQLKFFLIRLSIAMIYLQECMLVGHLLG